jgi:serine/threonine-protein kinase
MLHEGQVIRSTYKVERFLGEGGFAEVYRVRHKFLGRQAMKIFKTVGMTLEEIERSLSEATVLSRIGHPNIVRVFDANTTETSKGICGFFTMEYVAGGSLEQFWRSHSAQFVPADRAVDIIRQVCRGLAIAHAEQPPIVHRDIKPQNILVGYDLAGLRVRVSDFGLAKHANPLTLLVSAKGTRSFKSPEALRNFQHDSCAGDVWALGSTLYLLLTDRLPFCEVNESASIDSTRFERPIIPPSRLNIQVDPYLDQIVLKCIAVNPQDRYQNAMDVLRELDQWKPQPILTSKQGSTATSEASKTALGIASPIDREKATEMVEQAKELARERGKLMEAADLMEEALNKWPDLRQKYEYLIKIWRRGISY